MFILIVERYTDPLAEGWRAFAHIHRYIKDFALGYPHELPLGVLVLVVQAPQNAIDRFAVIILHEGVMTTVGFEFALTKGLHEEAPLIAKDLRGH